jgi:hypothetical protein
MHDRARAPTARTPTAAVLAASRVVMRLCKPPFVTSDLPLPIDGAMLPSAAGGPADVSLSVPLATTPSLGLPQSFGDIYLGETLSAFVSAANQAPYGLAQFQLKIEVQTSSQRQVLVTRAGSGPSAGIDPAARADCIVRHELREVGVHILIVTAVFNDADNEPKNLRKFFKFNVQNPLSMKSKSHTLAVGTAAESILVETQLQNTTATPLYLTSVQFAPAPALAVDDLNRRAGDAREQLACLKPGDVQQYMYRLRAAAGAPADTLRAASALGRMDVNWLGPMAEPGHLQSNLVQRRQPPARALEVRVLRLDSAAPVPALHGDDGAAAQTLLALCEVPFRLTVRLTHAQPATTPPAGAAVGALELKLFWAARTPPLPAASSSSMLELAKPASPAAPPAAPPAEPLVFTGVSGRDLGSLPPGGTLDVELDFVALSPGLHKLSGLVLYDRKAGVSHDGGLICELLVLDAGGGLGLEGS